MRSATNLILGVFLLSACVGAWANKNDVAALSGEEIVLSADTKANKGADPKLSRLKIDHRNLKRYKTRK